MEAWWPGTRGLKQIGEVLGSTFTVQWLGEERMEKTLNPEP